MDQDIVNAELEFEKELLAPYTHLRQIRGKQLRAKIALAFNHWLKLPEDKLQYIVNTVYMLHVGTLLIDDIQDNTIVRRGQPAAHCIFGVPITVNASLHVISLVMERILPLGPKATEIFSKDLLEVVRGQGIEIYWRDNFICPTEEQHNNMIKQKTGGMFSFAVRLCQLFSDSEIDYSPLALQMALYFQIRDDYCNLKQQEALEEWPSEADEQANKDSFCEDLTEGKYSLPIIHAMGTPESGRIMNILRQRTEDPTLKRYCVSLLEKAGSIQYTYDVLSNMDRALRAEVARLGGNPDMEAVLEELASWKRE